MKTYNELAEEINKKIELDVAPSQQKTMKSFLFKILDEAFRYEVADKTNSTLTVKTQSSKNIMSLNQIMKEGWELINEEDHILQYERISDE